MISEITVNGDTPFIIYGGGEVGNNCYATLIKQGYKVVAALDMNKCGEHIVEGVYTYKLEDDACINDYKDTAVVIICLANGMIHKNVADRLHNLGYEYIIFLPLNYCINDKEKSKLTRLYNMALQAENDLNGSIVKAYEKYVDPNISVSNSIIKENGRYVTAWVRMELLFSESYELWKGDKTKVHGKIETKDKNIGSDNPCESLFRYFSMQSGDYNRYFDSRREEISEEAKKKELNNREELYWLFKHELNKGMDFFIEGAPMAMWNPKKYFNLIGGHHRTLFLLNEGHTLFPINIEHDDFEKWCNESKYEKLKNYLRNNRIEKLYAPCPHPGLINFPVQCDEVGETKLKAIMSFFSNKDIHDMTVLDCGNDEGYFARNMDRIGAKSSVFMNMNNQQTDLAYLMNQVLYRDNTVIENKDYKCIDDEYDILFAINLFDNKEITNEDLMILNSICNKYLFIEVNAKVDIKGLLSKTKFNKYFLVHREYRKEDINETYVLYIGGETEC